MAHMPMNKNPFPSSPWERPHESKPYKSALPKVETCLPFTAWPWMVGFESQIETLSRMAEDLGKGSSYPPYNIVKHDEDNYTVEMAVAGFKRSDIKIQLKDNVLTITGAKENKRDEENYVHRGLGQRSFKNEFVLADHVEVAKASLIDGILFVELERRIPEEHKPKVIDIQ